MNNFRKLTTAITILATIVSIAIALHPDPTAQQSKLGEAAVVIMVKGATALMGLPNTVPELE